MATSTAAPSRVTTWDFDPAHSAAHFSVRHMMVSTVRGEFGKISGTVKLDPSDPSRTSAEASPRAAAGRPPQEPRLLRRREVPHDRF